MAVDIRAPSATASTESHADWLELQALCSADSSSSLSDLTRAIRATGTIEEVLDELDDEASPAELSDPGDTMSEAVAESAASELDDRDTACAGTYPFVRGAQYVSAPVDAVGSVYVFLLLLSTQGTDAGPDGLSATELFEDLAACAAQSYFGGASLGTEVYQFGFPRRRALQGFRPAIEELCRLMGEGGNARDLPNVRYQKDAALDLVVWRPFPDGRFGKLVAFGQCAAGRNWRDKLTEMNPRAFVGSWMTTQISVEPIRLFFCPFRGERESWISTVLNGGVLFDRCRIAHHCQDIDADILARCERFCGYVLGSGLTHA